MPRPFIEHVNLTVTDLARSAAMLKALFGWEERWHGPARDGGRTIHVGSADCYFALYAPPGADRAPASFQKGVPLNHVGIEVDDLDATERRVIDHGLHPFNHDDYAPGRRFYFFDADGIEYEIVSYRG